jgi:agmatinase
MLPERVYVSFDIDALDPSLCPHTGTPVPGGLSFNQATLVLGALKQSGKKVVGFDLVEVCPGEHGDWDANVGARLLYKLCGACA